MLEIYKCVHGHSKEGIGYMKMIMYTRLQNKEDWKGFTSYEGMSKLFKINKDEN